MQPNMVNVNEMDYDRWDEWDRLWTEGNKWNMNNEVQTEGNEIKHEQWSVDWRKWDETWTIKLII